ncbi:dihydromonapterin reductase / dihydrofolate reductase [Marinospirillum celere]|uniref:Dihydromonapterin reductase n=2 Tax=Marinospirillum celere TaxID=1122252 RepID=A0A1I1HC12_9GAMM|nr:dihydromonapterin reductase / dihydrofolate reductase [Marinospirillum celere]
MTESTTYPVLITGAGQRAGLYLAEQLLACQQPVVISYRSPKPGVDRLQKLGAQCIQADFATNAGVLAFARRIKEDYSGLRALVHNASDWSRDPLPEEDPEGLLAAETFQKMFQIHQQAPFLLNNQLAPLLLKAAKELGQATDIVHLTDDVVRRGSAKHSAYVASKAGLESLSLSFAARWAPDIKVNTIAPALLAFNEGDDAAYRHKTLSKSPLYMEPGFGVLWQTLDYLLHQPYMTGNLLRLNGGRHLKN